MRKPAGLRISLARLAIDLLRQKNDHDPRSLVIETIREGRHPDRKTLAAALRQPVPQLQEVVVVPLTEPERAELACAIETGTIDQFRNRISADRWKAAINTAAQKIAEEEALLKDYVARTCVLKTSLRQGGRPAGRRRTREGLTLTLADERRIRRAYFDKIRRLASARAEDDSLPRAVKTAAKEWVAREFSIGTRTVQRIVSGYQDPQRRPDAAPQTRRRATHHSTRQ